MKNRVTFVLLTSLFIVISCCCCAMADEASDELVRKVQPATVIVFVLDGAGNRVAQGSGFFFKYYGHLITNYHVLGKAVMAKVKTPDGREFEVKSLLAQDKSDDLVEALVDISYGSVPYLTPADSPPDLGELVTVIGSPWGVDKVVSQGYINSFLEIGNLGRCIVHGAHSFPGSSGSPVVNARGEVVGIETAAIVGKPNVNFAVPVERFSGLSPDFRELRTAQAAETSVESEAQPSSARPEALQNDTRMADSGDPAAQVRLAEKYQQGRDPSHSCFEAFDLYRRAADQGNLQAQFHLGIMYYGGECMGKNLSEAAKWLKKAAEGGSPDAQRVYGRMCFNGEGMERDRVAACMWMFLAASRGNGDANNLLRFMVSELSRQEVDTAREMARNWKPVH